MSQGHANGMSTAKRTRARQAEAGAAPSLPPSKKAKTSQASSSLAFLADENQRAGRTLSARYTNGVKNPGVTRVDESKAVVGQQDAHQDAPEIVEISSGEESSEYHSSDNDDDDEPTKALTNGSADADAVMADADGEQAETEAPSFGDLLQASHPDAIDVQAAFADRQQGTQALVPMNADRSLAAPTATSLGTVLTQALRTNDRDLLESCFQMTDIPSIRSTIQRLQSPLVAALLQRLAERLHKRPGRAGNLMVWVQWSLVSHGGYLAGQPDLLKKLKSLSRVIKDRANGLQSLVTLKGKLDMLSAQIDLRKSIQDATNGRFDDDHQDQEAGVIYVEGEGDDSSDDEHDPKSRNPESSDVDDLPMANGIDHNSSDDEEEDAAAAEGMFDVEADETSDDEGEELSEDDDESDQLDQEDDDESASDDEAPAPVKPTRPQQRPTRRR